jgi:hypothetical protein
MDDAQKWLEAAAGIEQDLEYLGSALDEHDIRQLKIALAVYRKNAASGVKWPNPDDLYCINAVPYGQQMMVATDMRRDHRLVC